MKKYIFTVAILITTLSVNAQNYVDALRYTQLFPTGSARSVSMGNAFGSLGGDMSSFYTNPAGLGVYRKSEFAFSPGFDYSKTKADYYGSSAEDFKYNFRLNNIGYIGTYNSNKKTGWVSASFGIAYNQLKDFNSNIMISGNNQLSSYADYFKDFAGSLAPEDLDAFYERLAFDAYVIDTFNNQYVTWLPSDQFEQVSQRRVIRTKGGIGEYSFAFGTNLSHILYFGASLSILKVNYNSITEHKESDIDNISYLSDFTFSEEFKTNGTGYTFRLGVIVKPVDFIRIGLSGKLPTVYNLEEKFITSMTSAFDGEGSSTYYPDYNIPVYDYQISTPLTLTGSIGFQFKKFGILSIDAEYINYSTARFNEGPDYMDIYDENNNISEALRKVLNLRTGGEVRFGPLAIRGGFAYFPSPYKDGELNEKSKHMEISGGIGIRQDNFFIDLGTVYNMHKEKFNLYDDPGGSNISDLEQNKFRFVTTIGFRF